LLSIVYGILSAFSWLTHPDSIVVPKIETAEQVKWDSEQIEYARRIVESFETGKKDGKVAYALDGNMIDMPLSQNAQKVLERARAAGKM
jgi:citrate lyase beta subunit